MALKVSPYGMLDPEGKYPNPLTGQKYSKFYTKWSLREEPKGWSLLKAYQDRNIILQKIHSKSILLVSLPTGTGKTVIVPRLLFHYFNYDKKIIVTTPRQTTTAKAGAFAALCFDVPLFHLDDKGKDIINAAIAPGNENRYPTGLKIVGYKHGESKDFADKDTKLLFTTDGSVKSMITGDDPNLEEYGGIVIDEVHERSVSIDILISLVMDILNRRKDFKIIFMSATMDLSIFENYFKKLNQGNNYNIYQVPEAKTTYKINHIKLEKPLLKNANKLIDNVYDKIHEIMLVLETTKQLGDILVFVSSEAEINKLKIKINQNIKKYSEYNRPYVISMTAKTSEDDITIATKEGTLQKIKPNINAPKGYARKLIIATPMAESSITFEDKLIYVIDLGMSYSTSYDADKYAIINGKNYVTQANIEQRCGRTGRNCNGTCIQLYTEEELSSFKRFTVPEILSKDFTIELLNIMKLEINKKNIINTINFVNNMIEPLDNYKSFIAVAYKNIKEMDFIDKNGNMTELGNICSDFSRIDIRIAKMVIGGYFLNCIDWTIMLGAILNLPSISFTELFRSLSDEETKDPKIKKHYDDTIKKFIKPEGDHISLLIIYYLFLQNNSSEVFAKKNYLDHNKLTSIQKAHNDLLETIYKQDARTRVNILDKFINVKTQFNNVPNYTAFGGYNDKTKKQSTKKQSTKKQSPKIKKYNKYKYGSRNYSKRNIQNNKSNSTLFNRNSKNGGGFTSEYNKNKKYKFKRYSKYKSRLNNTHMHSQTHTDTNTDTDTNLEIDLGLSGGSIDINTKRRMKYMELFTLANFQSRNKSFKLPKTNNLDDIFTRIIAALYYGFSTNIACYSGTGKDYNVKFSNVKGVATGRMSKSTFAYKYPIKQPDWLIYNTFVISQEFGKLEKKGDLNIVSILEPKHLQYFFDLKELHKNVMTEIN